MPTINAGIDIFFLEGGGGGVTSVYPCSLCCKGENFCVLCDIMGRICSCGILESSVCRFSQCCSPMFVATLFKDAGRRFTCICRSE